MKNLFPTRSTAWRQRIPNAFPLLLFAGLAILIVLADRMPMDLESISSEITISQKFIYYWQGVVYQFFPGPYVYRVLIPYFYGWLNQTTHISLITIDLYLKVLLVVAAQLGLFHYLIIHLERGSALIGVFLFDSLMGYLLSFIKGPSIIESIDILNFTIITLGLMAIEQEKRHLLLVILITGLLNRETPMILVPVLFLHEWMQHKTLQFSSLIFFISVLVFVGIRISIHSHGGTSWFNINELESNLSFLSRENNREVLIGNTRLVMMLAPFLVIGFYRFREQPQFFRIAATVVPLLIVIHYMTGRIIESRLWFPLFPFLIPLVAYNLTRFASRKE